MNIFQSVLIVVGSLIAIIVLFLLAKSKREESSKKTSFDDGAKPKLQKSFDDSVESEHEKSSEKTDESENISDVSSEEQSTPKIEPITKIAEPPKIQLEEYEPPVVSQEQKEANEFLDNMWAPAGHKFAEEASKYHDCKVSNPYPFSELTPYSDSMIFTKSIQYDLSVSDTLKDFEEDHLNKIYDRPYELAKKKYKRSQLLTEMDPKDLKAFENYRDAQVKTILYKYLEIRTTFRNIFQWKLVPAPVPSQYVVFDVYKKLQTDDHNIADLIKCYEHISEKFIKLSDSVSKIWFINPTENYQNMTHRYVTIFFIQMWPHYIKKEEIMDLLNVEEKIAVEYVSLCCCMIFNYYPLRFGDEKSKWPDLIAVHGASPETNLSTLKNLRGTKVSDFINQIDSLGRLLQKTGKPLARAQQMILNMSDIVEVKQKAPTDNELNHKYGGVRDQQRSDLISKLKYQYMKPIMERVKYEPTELIWERLVKHVKTIWPALLAYRASIIAEKEVRAIFALKFYKIYKLITPKPPRNELVISFVRAIIKEFEEISPMCDTKALIKSVMSQLRPYPNMIWSELLDELIQNIKRDGSPSLEQLILEMATVAYHTIYRKNLRFFPQNPWDIAGDKFDENIHLRNLGSLTTSNRISFAIWPVVMDMNTQKIKFGSGNDNKMDVIVGPV